MRYKWVVLLLCLCCVYMAYVGLQGLGADANSYAQASSVFGTLANFLQVCGFFGLTFKVASFATFALTVLGACYKVIRKFLNYIPQSVGPFAIAVLTGSLLTTSAMALMLFTVVLELKKEINEINASLHTNQSDPKASKPSPSPIEHLPIEPKADTPENASPANAGGAGESESTKANPSSHHLPRMKPHQVPSTKPAKTGVRVKEGSLDASQKGMQGYASIPPEAGRPDLLQLYGYRF